MPVFLKIPFLVLILCGLISPLACGGPPLSDAARRQKIERMYADYKTSFPHVEDLPAEEVLTLMQERKILFVDVREPEEQAVSMLPGAVSHTDFMANPSAYSDHVVIGYCTISYRSGKLARRLARQDIHMINLQGGILAWLHAGGRIHRNGRPIHDVHVYGPKWNLAPIRYQAVW